MVEKRPSSEVVSHSIPHIRANQRKNSLHRLFQYKWDHPSATTQEIGAALGISKNNVWVTTHRLRKMDLSTHCPECWSGSLLDGVCQSCGFEPAAPYLPLDVRFDQQSPTNHLHSGNELGSIIGPRGDFNELRLKGIYPNDGLLVKQRMDRSIEDSLTRDVKSELLQFLKSFYPTEAISDYAGKLCIKEVVEFRAKYPLLAASKNVRRQLAINVMKRLKLLYPILSRPHVQDITALQEVSGQ